MNGEFDDLLFLLYFLIHVNYWICNFIKFCYLASLRRKSGTGMECEDRRGVFKK